MNRSHSAFHETQITSARGSRLLHVRVRLYGPLADIAATREVTLALPERSLLEDVWPALFVRSPRLNALRERCALARNGAWASPGVALEDGDEIDVIPPVSGG